MIQIQCGLCGGEGQVSDEKAGTEIDCPFCGVSLDVPGEASVAVHDQDPLAQLASATPQATWSNQAWDHGRKNSARKRRRRVEHRSGTSGLAVASLVLGVLSLLVMFIPYVGLVSLPLSIAGLVLGIVATSTARRGEKSVAITGLCISAFSLILFIVLLVLGLVALAMLSGMQ